jgi:hypothetical protein
MERLFVYCILSLIFPPLFACKGAIELSILSEYYGREIAAYDIQTTRCDLYGQVSDPPYTAHPHWLPPNVFEVLSFACLVTGEEL